MSNDASMSEEEFREIETFLMNEICGKLDAWLDEHGFDDEPFNLNAILFGDGDVNAPDTANQ